MWVQVPPAVPDSWEDVRCRASPPDPAACLDDKGRGRAYAYLLGLYLGDGMLSRGRRGVWRLRITLDTKYPGIIALAHTSIREVADRGSGETRRTGCIEVYSDWKHWVCAFPQHGPGRKHERQIELEPWQVQLASAHPRDLIVGLIQSDGCRSINRVKSYSYPRYFFSNRSIDIQRMFIEACARIEVECRQDGPNAISVARRASVEILDQFVGPKA